MSKDSFMEKIGEKAKFASINLSRLNISKKNSVLKQFSQYLKTNKKLILNANRKDISRAKSRKIKESMISRLELNNEKIDIVNFSEQPEVLISRALSPATPLDLYIDEDDKYCIALFNDDELEFAIGRG